jgi:hypothetical protein
MSAEFVPSDRTVWQNYNERLEMPISFSVSLLVFTLAVFLLALSLWMPSSTERRAVAISLVDGKDLFGEGAPNSGAADPIHKPDPPKPTDPTPAAKPDLSKPAETDPAPIGMPNVGVNVPDASDDYRILGQKLQDRLKPNGGEKGPGADATLARSMRWVMKFNVRDGKEYVAQLAVLKAVILVPVPPANAKMMLFDDLAHPKPSKLAGDADLDKLSKQIRFRDTNDEAVKEITAALGITSFKPQAFFAFFPKEVEDELAKKEREFLGLKPEEIRETIFRVTVRNGAYEIAVIDQKKK